MKLGTSDPRYVDVCGLDKIVPSYRPRQLSLPDDLAFSFTNPSITSYRGSLWMIIRMLNYNIVCDKIGMPHYKYSEFDERGNYILRNRNALIRFDNDYSLAYFATVEHPDNWPAPNFKRVLGFEDCRLFQWRDELWVCASVKELYSDGKGRMVLARIEGAGTATPRFDDWTTIHPGGRLRDEKNWMPLVDGEQLRLVYTVDPLRVLDVRGDTILARPQRFSVSNVMRGGTVFIPYDTGWLGLIHELIYDFPKFYYYHRFIWIDHAFRTMLSTRRFFFTHIGIEFATGLCRSGDPRNLVISFGVQDNSCFTATVSVEEVSKALTEARPVFSGTVGF